MTEISEAAKAKWNELVNGTVAGRHDGPRFIQDVSDAAKEACSVRSPFVDKALAPFILPEPVDPLVAEAREIAARFYNECGGGVETSSAQIIRKGEGDNTIAFQCALAGLKRGLKIVKEKP